MNEEEEGNKSLISMYGNEYKKQMKKHSQVLLICYYILPQ